MGDSVKELRERAALLNKATDELNEALSRAEQALADTGLGVPGSVLMSSTVGPGAKYLVFIKLHSGWRLVIEHEHGRDRRRDPVLNASREDRIRAAGLLPDLVRAMLSNAEDLLAQVEEAASACSAAAAELKKPAQLHSSPSSVSGVRRQVAR